MCRPNVRFPTRFFNSVRFRLTLWYLAVLMVILSAFGLTVYYAQQRSLTTQFDDLLRTRIQQIALTYDATTQRLDITTPPSPLNNRRTPKHKRHGARAEHQRSRRAALATGRSLQTLGDPTPASVAAMVSLTAKASTDTTRGLMVILPDESLTLASNGKPADYGLIGMAILQQQRVVAYLTFGAPTTVAKQLSALATTLLVAGALVLLLAAVGGFWLADRAMRPIRAITAMAQQISGSDLGRRLAFKRRDELVSLRARSTTCLTGWQTRSPASASLPPMPATHWHPTRSSN